MALTTNIVTQAESITNLAVGQVVTDAGAAADTTFPIGFTPRYVCFDNLTDRIKLEWYEGMAANSAIRTVAAGTRTLDVSSGLTVNASGTSGGNSFMVKAADIIASKVFSYLAKG
jgi:hypothetical protein